MDEGLKQRIIGALVLIVAAVVFLPMLLSGQDETVEVVVDVPEQPVLDQQPIAPAEPVPLPQPPQVPEIPAADTASEQPAAEVSPAQPPTEPAVAEEVSAEPVKEPEPAPVAPPAAVASGDWVIQLGSFSSSANAEGLSETLRKQGYNAYTHSVTVQGKAITRVYVGPLASREAANRLRDELASKRGSKGLVVAYDADSGRG
ncbi:SPOR domain-containing protein [Halopseudomonas sabulinigri]|uniref:SPOR domain-containing protein n=1 Tax=Halopseudomonas sabulinigri TaxID=472181 RepID=A0ABP9ZL23_9GAMM